MNTVIEYISSYPFGYEILSNELLELLGKNLA